MYKSLEITGSFLFVLVLFSSACSEGWETQKKKTSMNMAKVNQTVQLYTLKNRKVPKDLSEVYPNGDTPKDAWGNAFQLVVPGPGRMDFDLVSYGADGTPGGNTDLKWSELKR